MVVIASYLYQFDWLDTLVNLLYLYLPKIKYFLREKCNETNQTQGNQAIYPGHGNDRLAGYGASPFTE